MTKFGDLLDALRSGKSRLPEYVEFTDDEVEPPPDGTRASPGKNYFAVVINELFLETNRRWFREFDPTVVAITDFVYGNEAVSLPFVVGPSLLAGQAGGVRAPQGMLYKDTRVAGIHPFRGGRVSTTVLLCQSVRQDYAKQLLNLVETVSGALPFGTSVEPFVKVGRAVLGGVEAMFEMEQTQALAGLRREFDHDLGEPIRPTFFALIDSEGEPVARDRLRVIKKSLHAIGHDGVASPYRDKSYVLFSTRVVAESSDVRALPFSQKADSVVQLAASLNDTDWERVKSELIVLLGELLSSRDLTEDQAYQFHQSVVDRAKRARQAAKGVGTLATHEGVGRPVDEFQQRMRDATVELRDLD